MKETEDACTEGLGIFQNIFGQGYEPEVFVTGRKLALMNAIPVVFPNCSLMLCRWHIMTQSWTDPQVFMQELRALMVTYPIEVSIG